MIVSPTVSLSDLSQTSSALPIKIHLVKVFPFSNTQKSRLISLINTPTILYETKAMFRITHPLSMLYQS